MNDVPDECLEALAGLRKDLVFGDNIESQEALDKICEKWRARREILRPNEKDELFDLVTATGRPNGITSERWLCHLLALRHRCTHVLLRWTGSGLGNVFVFQVRAWNKSDSPGHLDISVGGHVTSGIGLDTTSTAESEMSEELGIDLSALKGGRLTPCGGYESYNERRKDNFFNKEWRDVYVADLTTESFTRIDFKDKEVIGMLLCPESEALNFLDTHKNKHLAVASALRGSLKQCLKHLNNKGA